MIFDVPFLAISVTNTTTIEVAQLQQISQLAQKEIDSLNIRLASASNTSTRILQLKDNPTFREETIKLETLTALREENAVLLARLENELEKLPSNIAKMVPIRSLENARREIKSMEKVVADKEKRMQRLKEIWTAKSMEFREAVFSLLGWKLDFLQNGRVRVTHMFAGNSVDQSIEFDGEKGKSTVCSCRLRPPGVFPEFCNSAHTEIWWIIEKSPRYWQREGEET